MFFGFLHPLRRAATAPPAIACRETLKRVNRGDDAIALVLQLLHDLVNIHQNIVVRLGCAGGALSADNSGAEVQRKYKILSGPSGLHADFARDTDIQCPKTVLVAGHLLEARNAPHKPSRPD